MECMHSGLGDVTGGEVRHMSWGQLTEDPELHKGELSSSTVGSELGRDPARLVRQKGQPGSPEVGKGGQRLLE